MGALFILKEHINVIKHYFKEMKKIEYIAPELEVIELKYVQPLLAASDDEAPSTGDNTDEL